METYVLIVIPILWILISGLCERPLFSVLGTENGDLWSRGLFFGGDMLRLSFAFFYFYIYFKLFAWLSQLARSKFFKEPIPSSTNMKKFFSSFLYITMAIFCASFLLVFIVKQSSLLSSHERIIASSELYMKMDMALFPTDPRLWIIDALTHTRWDFVVTYVYRKINWAFVLVFTILLLFKKTLLRKYLITFFLAPTLALPLWIAWPAISPNEMYRNNMFHVTSINKIKEEYDKVPLGYHLSKFMDLIEVHMENPHQEYPLISTNPSMHVCWGFLISYFAILLWRPLALFFVPWFFLNCVSTLYTFQHYLIDIPVGMIYAIITIMLTDRLFKFETKYYTGNYDSLYFLDVLQEDMRKIITFKKWKDKTS